MAATNHPNRNNRLVAAPRMDYASLFSCVKGRPLHWWVQGPLMVSTAIIECEDRHPNNPRIHRYTDLWAVFPRWWCRESCHPLWVRSKAAGWFSSNLPSPYVRATNNRRPHPKVLLHFPRYVGQLTSREGFQVGIPGGPLSKGNTCSSSCATLTMRSVPRRGHCHTHSPQQQYLRALGRRDLVVIQFSSRTAPFAF